MKGIFLRTLHQLAALYGVQTAYYDVGHRRRVAAPESLLPVLRALGAPLQTFQDVPAALRERRQALWRRGAEPVVVVWEGSGGLDLRLPDHLAGKSIACRLVLEGGETRTWVVDAGRLAAVQSAEVEGVSFVVKRLALSGPLPWGYHRLTLETQGARYQVLIICAPRRAYPLGGNEAGRSWGGFLPLYALRSRRSWGGGDLTDLETLLEWVAGLGGGLVGTLPLLAAFLDEPCEPSPYAPASRLFWNEFYLDVARVPEVRNCPGARALLESAALWQETETLRSLPVVEYRRQMSLKRRVIEELARSLFSGTAPPPEELRSFVKDHPGVEDYARFRAVCERQGRPWPQWPRAMREGLLGRGDYDPGAKNYHVCAQWLVHRQLEALADKARRHGEGLYLDLPLGVHSQGYDTWRERACFAAEVCGGAPPDSFFTRGQNWEFPPLHPEAIRERGHRYVIAYLRHHLRFAGLLRVDHVMGLHRLFWIPKGGEPGDGVYVRYPAEDLYAVLTLESHRGKCAVVGENLGTVPSYVNASMVRHGMHGMYVLQYEVTPDGKRPLRAVAPLAMASLNTHDMPPFASFWRGQDIAERRGMGLLDAEGEREELAIRRALKEALVGYLNRNGGSGASVEDPAAVLRACLGFLGASRARVVLVNLEDLWLESAPQNVPGTGGERLNWRRKTRYGFEDLSLRPGVLETLREVERRRRKKGPEE